MKMEDIHSFYKDDNDEDGEDENEFVGENELEYIMELMK